MSQFPPVCWAQVGAGLLLQVGGWEQDLLPVLRLGPASPVYSCKPQSVASLLRGSSVGSKEVFPQLFPLCRSIFNMPEQSPGRSK